MTRTKGMKKERRTKSQKAANRAAIRSAMLSLYYDSLGSDFEVRGAPSVLVPPTIRRIPQQTALEQLRPFPAQFREACWLLARGVKPFETENGPKETYPPALDCAVGADGQPRDWLKFGEKRREYRDNANLFSAALTACRNRSGTFDRLVPLLYSAPSVDPKKLKSQERMKTLIGAADFGEILANMTSQPAETVKSGPNAVINGVDQEKIRHQIIGLERDVGVGIDTMVNQLADALAFAEFYPAEPDPSKSGRTAVLPVTSFVQQNVKSLITVSSVTTLAIGEFKTLVVATDPSNWHKNSDVFETSEYIKGPYDFTPTDGPPTDGSATGLMNEKVAFSWGDDLDQRGTFHNVLNVRRTVVEPKEGEEGSITIEFSLCRSISSAVLWDRRLGGIEVDSGFIKVRHLYGNTWRVTYKKYLQFSDRTPNSYGSDWTDLGQMLNYFAPAALTWWMESETYSMGEFKTDSGKSPITTREDLPG